jgi:OmcA/MtrC family decaheme c-type cytochrome
MNQRYLSRFFLMVFVAVVLALAGCDGDDGATGPQGEPGPTVVNLGILPEEVIAELDVQSQITGVTIASSPVVEFTVTTANSVPITGIGALWEDDPRSVRFTITKLVPGTSGEPSHWVSYTRETTNDGSTPPDYDTGSSLVDHGDGTYTFTFNTDVASVTGVTYEPTLTHRVAGQIGSGSSPLEDQNLFLDFVPAGGDVTETRNIAVVDSCNECHGHLVVHGRRFLVEYCVNCHNPDLAAGEGNFPFMIHKIHTAQTFDVLDDGIDYSEVTYPQEVTNCRKCHNGANAATPDGDNWMHVPNMVACGACHTEVNFATGENHEGIALDNNSLCTLCHPASGGLAGIEDKHLTDNATPHNPSVPSGLSNFSYHIAEARVDGGNVLQIDFSILRDGTPLNLLNLPADLTDSPGFLFSYTMPQDDMAEPVDFNNLGRTAGQPQSVDLVDDLINGGNIAASSTEGLFTATIADAFPNGARMRTVALQSRFRQIVDGETFDRRTISTVKNVTGDTVRRAIIDPAKCAGCHEWLQLHGGSRVLAATSDPDQAPVCTLCHNPNLSSSGRTANPAEPLLPETVEAVGADPLLYPERTNNFKDLIHGIHAADHRTEDYEFVRNRLNGIYFNWSEVTFPGILRNCLTCHKPGTYELPLPANLLMTTERTTSGDPDEDRDAILGARDGVPNGTDLVHTPIATTCYMCHDSALAVAHMEQNGGQINVLLREELVVGADFVGVGADTLTRQEVLDRGTIETCDVCHGNGRVADLKVMHEIE